MIYAYGMVNYNNYGKLVLDKRKTVKKMNKEAIYINKYTQHFSSSKNK